MRCIVAVLAAAGVLCAACASAPREPGAPPTPDGTAAAGNAGAAGNKARAEAEAARLLGELRLPAGAAELAKLPTALDGPILGRPMTSSLIDRTRSWQVPMSPDSVVAWLRGHPPVGLTPGGTADATIQGVQTRGLAFDDRNSTAWQGAELQVGVAPLSGGGSALRADGIALWIDPRPTKDTASGRRVHVSVADGCPSSDRGIAGVANAGSDLTERLLPARTPTRGLLCRYEGLNGRPFALAARRPLDAATAGRIAAAAAAISLSHLGPGPHSCPMDDASATLLVLAYPDRDVDLWYSRTGCRYLSNGSISTSDFPYGLESFSTAVAALGG